MASSAVLDTLYYLNLRHQVTDILFILNNTAGTQAPTTVQTNGNPFLDSIDAITGSDAVIVIGIMEWPQLSGSSKSGAFKGHELKVSESLNHLYEPVVPIGPTALLMPVFIF